MSQVLEVSQETVAAVHVKAKPTIRDVARAARQCFLRTGEHCSVCPDFCFDKLGERVELTIHRGNFCDTNCTIEQALSYFTRDLETQPTPDEAIATLPVIADIVAPPGSNLEQLLKSKVRPTPWKDSGKAGVDLNFDVLVVDVTVLEERDEQYHWSDETVLLSANLIKTERDADRVLAYYSITAELREYPLGGPWPREGGAE